MEVQQIILAKVLVDRLARLSADSIWAHRASGIRASLDKFLEQFEAEGGDYDSEHLDLLVQQGFDMLAKAAQEIPSPEEILAIQNNKSDRF